jgi:hypothetical protein
VTKDAASQEDWREGLVLVIEGVANQKDWSEVVVEEIESLPLWDIKVHPNDDGWYTSLTNRDFFYCRFSRYSHKRPRCQACGNIHWNQIIFLF